MFGSSHHCIAMLSEARRLYGAGQYEECLRLIESIRACSTQCGEHPACAVGLDLVRPAVAEAASAELPGV